MNDIKSWQWLVIAAGLLATLLCIVFAAFLTIENISQSRALQGDMVAQAVSPVDNGSHPPVANPTKTPFLPVRFPTSISFLFHPTVIPAEPVEIPAEPPQPEPNPQIDSLPDSYILDGVVTNPQWFTLDCEARTAVDWAAFFGVGIDENEFLGRLPHSDNPDLGFVGRFDGQQGQLPPNSYGVHADPVANLLNEYGVSARSGKGFSWDDIRTEISAGRPVITWVIYNTVPGYSVPYVDSAGNSTIVANFEHTIILSGYSPDTVYISDNGRYYTRALQVFLASWSALGNMAIMAGN